CPPKNPLLLTHAGGEKRGRFPILDSITIGNHRFEILEGMGGHLHGQIYLFSPDLGVFFPADTVINFDHLTRERSEYNTLAVNLVTSVNVDSDRAREERKEIVRIVDDTSGPFFGGRQSCLV